MGRFILFLIILVGVVVMFYYYDTVRPVRPAIEKEIESALKVQDEKTKIAPER